MKKYVTKDPYHFLLIFALLLSILSSCTRTNNLDSTPSETIIKLPIVKSINAPTDIIAKSIPTATMKNTATYTPIYLPRMKYADNLNGCDRMYTISPDAKWAFADCKINGDSGEYIWKLGEQNAALIYKSKNSEFAYPFFSPDGKWLLLAVQDGPLYLYNNGQWQSPRILSNKLPDYATPTWSPDSKSIAISYLVEGQALSIMKLDGSYKNILSLAENHMVSANAGNKYGPGWSPDSSKIAYVSLEDEFDRTPIQLWDIDISSGKKELLYSGKEGEVGNTPEWSPDGKIIYVEDNERTDGKEYTYVFDIKNKSFNILPIYIDVYPDRWSPNGKYMIKSYVDHYIYSYETGKLISVNLNGDFLLWKDDHTILEQETDFNIYSYTLPPEW